MTSQAQIRSWGKWDKLFTASCKNQRRRENTKTIYLTIVLWTHRGGTPISGQTKAHIEGLTPKTNLNFLRINTKSMKLLTVRRLEARSLSRSWLCGTCWLSTTPRRSVWKMKRPSKLTKSSSRNWSHFMSLRWTLKSKFAATKGNVINKTCRVSSRSTIACRGTSNSLRTTKRTFWACCPMKIGRIPKFIIWCRLCRIGPLIKAC